MIPEKIIDFINDTPESGTMAGIEQRNHDIRVKKKNIGQEPNVGDRSDVIFPSFCLAFLLSQFWTSCVVFHVPRFPIFRQNMVLTPYSGIPTLSLLSSSLLAQTQQRSAKRLQIGLKDLRMRQIASTTKSSSSYLAQTLRIHSSFKTTAIFVTPSR